MFAKSIRNVCCRQTLKIFTIFNCILLFTNAELVEFSKEDEATTCPCCRHKRNLWSGSSFHVQEEVAELLAVILLTQVIEIDNHE